MLVRLLFLSCFIFHAPCRLVPRADHGERGDSRWLAGTVDSKLEISIFVIIARFSGYRLRNEKAAWKSCLAQSNG